MATSAEAATFTVDSNGDDVDTSPGDGICATAGAVCTLRAALGEANALAGPDVVGFNAPMTISLAGALVVGTGTVLDGTTVPGYAGAPLVELLPSGPIGVALFLNDGGATVRGLAIGGFLVAGIRIRSSDNVVQACYLGTNTAGNAASPNAVGVSVVSPAPPSAITGNRIGGTDPGDGNLISGNGVGIELADGATGTIVQGNVIGLDAAGTAALPNSAGGFRLSGANVTLNRIGGSAPGARNVISGHSDFVSFGVQVQLLAGPTGNRVEGNFIGTNAAGTGAIPNYFGVRLAGGASNVIGGSGSGEGNVISGNASAGIRIDASAGNVIQGNLIGLDATGTAALGNGGQGLRVDNAAGNVVGGAAPGAGNVISGNADVGVRITAASNTLVEGNTIGLDLSGTAPVPNGGGGVHVYAGTGNRITRNRIASAVAGLAIDLDVDTVSPPDGVTPNDPLDADTGSNQLQNFPVLTSAVPGVGTTAIAGTLDSLSSTTFTVELFSIPSCHPSGNGDARTYLGAVTVTTDGGGNAAIAYAHGAALTPGSVVTATATDPSGNTSELSACLVVAAAVLPDLTVTKTHAEPFVRGQAGAAYTITVTNSGVAATAGTTTVVDTLPASLTATAISGSGWSCTLATLTCASADVVAPGASFPPITLTVNVAADAPASVVNLVAVSGGGESNTGNSAASDPTTVLASAVDGAVAVPAAGAAGLALFAAALLAAGTFVLRK